MQPTINFLSENSQKLSLHSYFQSFWYTACTFSPKSTSRNSPKLVISKLKIVLSLKMKLSILPTMYAAQIKLRILQFTKAIFCMHVLLLEISFLESLFRLHFISLSLLQLEMFMILPLLVSSNRR